MNRFEQVFLIVFWAAYAAVNYSRVTFKKQKIFWAAYPAVNNDIDPCQCCQHFWAAYPAVNVLDAQILHRTRFWAAYAAVNEAGAQENRVKLFWAAYAAVNKTEKTIRCWFLRTLFILNIKPYFYRFGWLRIASHWPSVFIQKWPILFMYSLYRVCG
jgi:hypothetical protein